MRHLLITKQTDQLARTRRNQQRCRERKRAHIAELESQVEDLQAKIRQCEPCASPRPPEHESALDQALRENAARQDLLSALGFDDETQRRFIESATKREAAHAILHGDGDRGSPSQRPGESLAETPPAPIARSDAQSAILPAVSAELRSSSVQAANFFDMGAELSNVDINAQASALDPAVSYLSTSRTRRTLTNTYLERELAIVSPDTRQIGTILHGAL